MTQLILPAFAAHSIYKCYQAARPPAPQANSPTLSTDNIFVWVKSFKCVADAGVRDGIRSEWTPKLVEAVGSAFFTGGPAYIRVTPGFENQNDPVFKTACAWMVLRASCAIQYGHAYKLRLLDTIGLVAMAILFPFSPLAVPATIGLITLIAHVALHRRFVNQQDAFTTDCAMHSERHGGMSLLAAAQQVNKDLRNSKFLGKLWYCENGDRRFNLFAPALSSRIHELRQSVGMGFYFISEKTYFIKEKMEVREKNANAFYLYTKDGSPTQLDGDGEILRLKAFILANLKRPA